MISIEIEDFLELKCVRVVTTVINANISIQVIKLNHFIFHLFQEVLSKICRKGNVFIEDISKFNLIKPPNTKMKRDLTLKSYEIQNFV